MSDEKTVEEMLQNVPSLKFSDADLERVQTAYMAEFNAYLASIGETGDRYTLEQKHFSNWIEERYGILYLQNQYNLNSYMEAHLIDKRIIGTKEAIIERLTHQIKAFEWRNRIGARLLDMVRSGAYTHREKDGALKLIAELLQSSQVQDLSPLPSIGDPDEIPF